MRKKIKQLAYGTFDYNEPKLSFSMKPMNAMESIDYIECAELAVAEGKDAAGEFTVRNGSGKKLRGVVYSTHPRMECLTPQFDGEEVRVRYQFHSEGLVEGDVRKGEFVIVCDQGEYNLSFVASVSKTYAETSIGTIKNMSDFVRLARESAQEAYQVFYSIAFSYLLKDAEEMERMLYEGIRKEAPSMQAVEAYLIGIGKKQPVKVYLEAENQVFHGVTASKKEQLSLRKENWGYISGGVKTDAEFIHLEKTRITPDDFLGSSCFFDYYIDAEKLHAGRNYGRIIFEFPEDRLVCEICVTGSTKETDTGISRSCECLKHKAELMQLYMDYRTRKIVTGVWAKQSIQILEYLSAAEPGNDLYRLMKVQAFLVNRQRQEASWILEDYKRSGANKNTPEWGYYLYLCTLMEREESYVDRLAGQIEEIFLEYSDNSLLFWVLLFVREDYYKNSSRRLKAIERWIENGSNSPFFYLEAFYLYWQDPYLLTKLEDFEIKVLNWARKHQVISKEIAAQILQVIPTAKGYDEKVFCILKACYKVLEKEEAAAAICGYLINGQKFSKKYHKWYALGVEHDVRITNLYEAYLLSADEDSIKQVPKVIFMYFQYHNTLSYQQLALLYAYIILHKEKYKKIYQNYRRTIEQFAVSQIEAGHIDENLAVIYKELLPLGILNAGLAEKLADVLFVHKLKVAGQKQFAHVIVVQKQWKHRQMVPIADGTAYFKAYTKDYCIVLVDAKGQLFADKSYYKESALFETEAYLEQVVKQAPMAVPYLVYSFDKRQKRGQFLGVEEEGISALCASSDVRETWKSLIQTAVVRHRAGQNVNSLLENCLKNVNYKLLSVKDRCFMLEQLIEHQMFEQAYELFHLYGYDNIESGCLLAICTYKITDADYEEDEFLLGLADTVFAAGRYNDVVLGYLCRYYNGPADHMAAVWKASKTFQMDTFDMEERIITQMLYTENQIEAIDEIYEAYCEKGSSDLIAMAYLSYFSHLYLVKDAEVSEQVFLQIEHRILSHQETTEVQAHALLKYYAKIGKLTEVQYKTADRLLFENICHNIYFGFYKKLDARLVRKYQLQDKYFVEYHSNPGADARISCSMNGESLCEELAEVYDGIFVKDFQLFFGDTVYYCVAEKDKEMASGQIEMGEEYAGEEQSRYTMLNTIYRNLALQETVSVKEAMKEYGSKKIAAEKIFKLI